MDPGDSIINGGNEWYQNTERRIRQVSDQGLLYLGMGVSGGEEGARYGPSLMPGGPYQAYLNIEDILKKVAAQVEHGPCVTYIGERGFGNLLISEAYDMLKSVGGLSNDECGEIFREWNRGELESFLIEITADIFMAKDEYGDGELVDKILDKTGMKETEMDRPKELRSFGSCSHDCNLVGLSVFEPVKGRARGGRRGVEGSGFEGGGWGSEEWD
ncbi:hypothetical protein LOK49_LG11G02748 [Camellia lanceoleosa]|uniref:Uncharacterized protein n=1 Tax=Camellia lanceoleosa TaxID=1840588 RepID=A0ACC0G2J2_9ERIC|nr:hypothetical protein LOK49_LG11G02748 [Camellia lanceoleosa]